MWCHSALKMVQNESGSYPNLFLMAAEAVPTYTEPQEIYLAKVVSFSVQVLGYG